MGAAFTGETSVQEYYSKVSRDVAQKVESMSATDLATRDEDELVQSLLGREVLESLEEDPARQPTAEGIESDFYDGPEPFAGGPRRREVTYHKVTLPRVRRSSNAKALRVQGSSWPIYTGIEKVATFRERDHAIVLRTFEGDLAPKFRLVRRMLESINSDIAALTPGFITGVKNIVRMRRSQLTNQTRRYEDQMQALGISVPRRPDAIEPVNVETRSSVQVLRSNPEKPTAPSQPYLDAQSVKAIVRLIDQAGKGIETAPTVYGALPEEHLRTIIVGYLNAVFDALAATGETFSVRGKTDILLNVPGGVVLITESKKWGGGKKYGETIRQLSGYLAWRHTAAVVVTFSDKKGLSHVVAEADKVVQEHESYRRQFSREHDTYRVSIHEHPADAMKTLEIHHLFFDLHAR